MATFIDFNESALQICEDAKGRGGAMKVRGIFQKADTRNVNGRIYGSSLWDRVLGDDGLRHTIESRRMLGTVEHPDSGTTTLPHISHIVTKIERVGNDIIGEAEILNTPPGLIIQELLRKGVPVGISSRGKGSSVMKNGIEYVNPQDFILETFDFVYKPSTPGAYPALQESALAGSAYSKDATMTVKIDQIKKFDVRAGEITTKVSENLGRSQLHDFHRECLEMKEGINTLFADMSDAEKKEHEKYGNEVSQRLESAYQALTAKLDKMYSGSDLSRRIENVVDTNTKAEGVDNLYKDLLKEANEENLYLRGRLDEVSTLVESSENDLLRRYSAATQLAEETLDKLQETTSALAEISAEHETLQARYEAAIELVAGVQEQQAAGRLAYLVREAVDNYPELGKFVKTLRSCKTESELDERIEELVSGLGLGKQKDESVLTSRLSFAGAVSADNGSDLNEDADTSKSSDKNRGSAEKILKESKDSNPNSSESMILDNLLESMNLK